MPKCLKSSNVPTVHSHRISVWKDRALGRPFVYARFSDSSHDNNNILIETFTYFEFIGRSVFYKYLLRWTSIHTSFEHILRSDDDLYGSSSSFFRGHEVSPCIAGSQKQTRLVAVVTSLASSSFTCKQTRINNAAREGTPPDSTKRVPHRDVFQKLNYFYRLS